MTETPEQGSSDAPEGRPTILLKEDLKMWSRARDYYSSRGWHDLVKETEAKMAAISAILDARQASDDPEES